MKIFNRGFLMPIIALIVSYIPLFFIDIDILNNISEEQLWIFIPYILISLMNVSHNFFFLKKGYDFFMILTLVLSTGLALWAFTQPIGGMRGVHYYITFFINICGTIILFFIILADIIFKKLSLDEIKGSNNE